MMGRRTLLMSVACLALGASACGRRPPVAEDERRLANMAELSALLQVLPGTDYETLTAALPQVTSLAAAHAALAELGALDAEAGVRAWLAETRARQFDAGDVVEVEGWEFARVEALMMAASLHHARELAVGPPSPMGDEQIDAAAAEDMMVMADVDFGGGDNGDKQMVGALDACVAACLAEDDCRTFTYGRLSHNHLDQRGACYLKGGAVRPRVDDRYISGVRR